MLLVLVLLMQCEYDLMSSAADVDLLGQAMLTQFGREGEHTFLAFSL